VHEEGDRRGWLGHLLGGSRSGVLGPLRTVPPLHFSFYFFFEFSKLISNAFLNSLKAFSRVAPKTKVVQNNILYNFALRCKPRI
jgi:hypothetical protein